MEVPPILILYVYVAVVPLFGCFYAKNPSPRAALLSIIGGVLTRVILEFALPKDGFLLLPYDVIEFYDYGPAASDLYPEFIDVDPSLHWNQTAQPCDQAQFEDYTGVDSLAGFLVSFLLFVGVQTMEHCIGRPLFAFAGSSGYIKDTTEHPLKKSGGAEGRAIPPKNLDETEGEDVDKPHASAVKFAGMDEDGDGPAADHSEVSA